ncbi:MAG: hypothetical protein KA760_04350 [Steroidobacteraceae bacterium]|jgi:hypothetical protein|nr:hypothetical protein [Pseudomonadota bacterium]MBP7608701.1 hypothetical protein [Steroidobacteraceae bacterium]MBP9129498.1 hypothetical protein [Steroidobacteraceae bacterium]
MVIQLQRSIVTASLRWLRPIARWLLKSGVTWKEFAELSRGVFVSVAAEEFGLRGRPTNVSRIALLTGMTRREVRRYRDSGVETPTEDVRAEDDLNHASRVLAGWHLDAEFIDEVGRPRALEAKGDGATFEQLVRRYAGDIPVTALIKELVRSNSIERTQDGCYRALRRFYMPRAMDGQAVERAGAVIADLATTVEHNLTRDATEPPRFEGRAQNRHVDPRQLPAFRAFMEREGQAFLERCDEWLSAHEAQQVDGAPVATLRLGVGVFAIQERMVGEES